MSVKKVDKLSEAEESIFAAALAVFSRKGRDGARMHEIAAEAGLNSALLHYYFGSKEDLFEAVLAYSVKRYMASVAAGLMDTASFRDLLKKFVDGFVDFGKDNLDVLRLVMGENLSGGERLEKIFKEASMSPEAPRGRFLASMVQAVEKGEIRPVDVEQTFITVISACLHFLLVYPMIEIGNPDALDRDAFIDRRKEHIFDLVYNGVKA